MVDYQVSVLSAIKAEVENADVRIDQAHIQKSIYGTSFLIGEAVNHGSQPAQVEGLGAAVLGMDGQILDMSHVSDSGQYLAPAKDPNGWDRLPFAIPLHGSFGDNVQREVFLVSVITDRKQLPAIRILESRHYVDSMGYFHLIGLIENDGLNSLSFPITGSLLDENGNIMDSVEGYLPAYVQPGSVSAFDLLDWKVVNHNPALQAMIHGTQIQIDPARVFPSRQRYFQLVPSDIRESRNELGGWTFQGSVNNFWTEPFRGVIVIVSIFSEDNHLIATNYQWIHPFDPLIGVGGNVPFDLQVSLDPIPDPSKYTYRILAIAESTW